MKYAFRFVLLCLFASVTYAQSSDANVSKAEDGAKSWLALVDSGKYGQAWAQTSKVFQSRLPEPDWDKGATSKLGSAGGVKSRELKSATPSENIQGAPVGHYVTIQYYTEFKEANPANEFVTMIQDPDGIWRVVGYGLQNADAPQGAPPPAPSAPSAPSAPAAPKS